jgi:hypothetical protein
MANTAVGVAEDVEKVNPDLVIRDKEGKPYTVRYDAVNAMLLNEFLKAHRKIEEQDQTIFQLKLGMGDSYRDGERTGDRNQKSERSARNKQTGSARG